MVAVTDFRTVAELARLISHNLWRLPGDFSAVAAIPESGRLPAALIGLRPAGRSSTSARSLPPRRLPRTGRCSLSTTSA